MPDYNLGKDIQEILNRLKSIEKHLENCNCRNNIEEEQEVENEQFIAERLDSSDSSNSDLIEEGYKWIICRVSLSRRCEGGKSWWSARCWSHLAKEETDQNGPAYTCQWIRLRYRHEDKTKHNTSSVYDSKNNMDGCQRTQLRGIFKLQSGKESNVVTSVG